MRIIDVSRLKGGEKLAKQIFDNTGRILLNIGINLSPYYIDKIKELGVQIVYIDDDISRGIIVEESISDRSRQESKHAVKAIIEKFCREGKTDNSSIMKSVDAVISDIYSNKDIMINITEIKANDNSIYSHSVNVCVLASIIGTHMGYNILRLKDLATGALLHDIGKIKIMNDKKLMSEFKSQSEVDNFISQNHSKIGYDFLSQQHFCSTYSRVGVLMHHERIDGNGYPLKLKSNEINEVAKLIAICDTFSNLISGNERQKAMPVNEAIEQLFAMSNVYFDIEIVRKFTMNISAYPNGCSVILNTKEKCLVVRQNKSLPLRPVVKVISDKVGMTVASPYEIDLCKELTLFVENYYEISL